MVGYLETQISSAPESEISVWAGGIAPWRLYKRRSRGLSGAAFIDGRAIASEDNVSAGQQWRLLSGRPLSRYSGSFADVMGIVWLIKAECTLFEK